MTQNALSLTLHSADDVTPAVVTAMLRVSYPDVAVRHVAAQTWQGSAG